MTHRLTINSLHDAEIECLCSWRLVSTGAMTDEECVREYDKHLNSKGFAVCWGCDSVQKEKEIEYLGDGKFECPNCKAD